jgi:CRISPR-associated protein (TIGR02584 family)
MNDCIAVAAPGGNPAVLTTLVWALLRQRGLRTSALHVVLHQRAQHWLHTELLGGDRPLEQLRTVMGDPALALLHTHPAALPDGALVDDDADPTAAQAFVETLWTVFQSAQDSYAGPVILALVGGSRRTLSVDSVVAFQLLARPQDVLLDVRIESRSARDPRSAFYFPEQLFPNELLAVPGISNNEGSVDREAVQAAEVRVSLVSITVPRLRHLLPTSARHSYAAAVQAGEDAIRDGGAPQLSLDLKSVSLHVGTFVVRMSRDQAIWFAALAVARRRSPDGWLDVLDTALITSVFEVCRRAWYLETTELSGAWISRGTEARLRLLGPIRSRLSRTLKDALNAHPHRHDVIPESLRHPGVTCERIRCDPARMQLPPELEALLLQEPPVA